MCAGAQPLVWGASLGAMGKKKAIAGLTRGHHQDGNQDELSFTKSGKDEVKVEEEAPLLTLGEQARAGRNWIIAYLAMAALISALWDSLHVELKVYETAAVWVSLFNNGTIGSNHPLEDQPGPPNSMRLHTRSVQ